MKLKMIPNLAGHTQCGVFGGFLFHRINIEKRPFWKSAWRFNKYKKADWNVEMWKRRDCIGGVSGAIGTFILFILGMV